MYYTILLKRKIIVNYNQFAYKEELVHIKMSQKETSPIGHPIGQLDKYTKDDFKLWKK